MAWKPLKAKKCIINRCEMLDMSIETYANVFCKLI